MKKTLLFLICILYITLFAGCAGDSETVKAKERLSALYGENREVADAYDVSLSAKCYNGTFIGIEKNGVVSYKGIPFAESPTGELRWKAPVAVSAGNKVYEAYYFGKSPIQTEAASELASYYPQGEDCLNLNIWTSNKTAAAGKTVMVFIHGGSYGWGGTADPLYDGQNFVEAHDDIVLVTIGYRIGLLGFMDFSSVEGEEEFSTSGNLGLLDQICALKWIHNNIEAFGGDPERITIFGESAGGGSVSLLPMIDDAKGLYQRAIAQSGSVALTYSKEECQYLTKKLLEKTGAKSMNDLCALSEAEIMELNEELNDYNNFPERDGIILPVDLYAKYESGAGSDIDMLIGTNADEARYWISEIGGLLMYKISLPVLYENNLKRISDKDMAYVNQFMKIQKSSGIWKKTEFYNEVMFRVPAILQASSHADNGGNTYMYYWTYPSAKKNFGACHAVELAYVFNNQNETIYTGGNIDSSLASEVQNMWVNFAKTGDPSTDANTWEKYNTETRKTMVLGSEIKMESDILGEQRLLIEPLIKYNFNGCYVNLSYNVSHIYKIIAVLLSILIVLVIGTVVIIKVKLLKRCAAKKGVL